MGQETNAEREAKERERQRVQEERNQAAEHHADLQERARNTPPEGYAQLREETERRMRESREALSASEYSRMVDPMNEAVDAGVKQGANDASEDNMTASNAFGAQSAGFSLPGNT